MTSLTSSTDEIDDKRFRSTPTQQMITSCAGAMVTVVLVTPLDVVKIRLQSQQKEFLSKRCFLYCNGLMDHVCHANNGNQNAWAKRPVQSTSTLGVFKTIVRNEGVLSLWSGLPPTLVMAIPSTIAYYVSYETLRVKLVDQYRAATGKTEYPAYLPLLAGAIARTFTVTIVNPLELIRTKMQSKRVTYKELRVACAELYQVRGIRGFWLGYTANLIRDVPFSAIYWGCYETQKKIFSMQQKEQTPMVFAMAAGAVAGAIAGTVTLPFDVVKTHKQLEMGDADFNVKDKKLATTTDVIKKIYRQTGGSGLFTGFVPRIIKIPPACAIMMSAYEYGKSFFTRYNRRKYEQEKAKSDSSIFDN